MNVVKSFGQLCKSPQSTQLECVIGRTGRETQPTVTHDDIDLIWGMGTWKMFFLYFYYLNIVLAILKNLFKNSEVVERNKTSEIIHEQKAGIRNESGGRAAEP